MPLYQSHFPKPYYPDLTWIS